MADYKLHDALADCLDRMQAGESLDDCLRDYPEHAPRLRDLLKTAALVTRAAQDDLSTDVADEQVQVRRRLESTLRKRAQSDRVARRRWIRLGGSLAAALLVLAGTSVLLLALVGPPIGNIFSNIVNPYNPAAVAVQATGVTPVMSPTALSATVVLAPRITATPPADSSPVPPVATSVVLMSPVPGTVVAITPLYDGSQLSTAVAAAMTATASPAPTRTSLPFDLTAMPTAGLIQSQPGLTASPTPLPPPAQAVDIIPLSAGEINDNARWDNYLLYRQNFLRDYAPLVHDVDVSGRQIITVSDGQGLPVAGARVQVYADQTLVSETRTAANGQTLFFPNAWPESRGVTAFRVVVSKGDAAGQFMLDANRGAAWDVTLPQAGVQQQTRLDVLFLLDTTGSMGDELAQLQNNILGISAQIDALDVDVRYGLVTYRDRGDAYVTRNYDFVPDVATFQASLRGEYADGGGDEPESLNEALHQAMQGVSWRGDDTIKLVFLVADAPPHLDYPGDYDYAQEMLVAAQRGIKIHPIASSSLSPIGEFIFRQIAQVTQGHFIFLTYQQGVPGAPGDARPDLHVGEAADPAAGRQGDYTVERLDELVLRLISDELAALTTRVQKQGIAAPLTVLPPGSLPPDAALGLGASWSAAPVVSVLPPTFTPTVAAALSSPEAITRTQIGLPLAAVLIGMGLFVGFILRPRPPVRKRKNDEVFRR
ncbi:MAG: VWA domain-containing protein [Chloroflexi bacterium]|nr:VWA domain-containing protein [Chloroflexota bacterium]